MIKLIFIFIIIGAIITFLINLFLIYIPLADIEKTALEAYSELDETKVKFNEIEKDVIDDLGRIKSKLKIILTNTECSHICFGAVQKRWIKDFPKCVADCEALANKL